jgi:hypothetical protein
MLKLIGCWICLYALFVHAAAADTQVDVGRAPFDECHMDNERQALVCKMTITVACPYDEGQPCYEVKDK